MRAKVLLIVASTLAALAIAEGISRWAGLGAEFADPVPLHDVPTRTVEGVMLWSSNPPRATEGDIARAAADSGAFTIVGLGDSIMYGTNEPRENTYLEQTRRMLAERTNRPVEILNLAVPGYNTRQEDVVFHELDGRVRPDLVLVHYWADDFRQYRVSGGYVLDVTDLAPDGRVVARALPIPDAVSDFLLLHSRLYALLTRALLTGGAGAPTDWRVVAEPLRDIDARTRRAGGRVVMLVSPMLGGPTPRSLDGLERLRDLVAGTGIEVIDLTEWVRGTPTQDIAGDACCHFNAAGHRLIAERLTDYLLAHDLKPAAANPGS
jgi:lysophospholipase L1-like esterase